MIVVVAAPPFATIQDLGRLGYRDAGVPPSGVADRESAVALNALLGNDPNAAMIEWAVAGGVLRFDNDAVLAIAGAEAECYLAGRDVVPMHPFEVSAGGLLKISRIVRGRFLLIGIRGGIDVPRVLGSRSTLLSAGFGGMEGRTLRNGDRLTVGDAAESVLTTPHDDAAPAVGGNVAVGAAETAVIAVRRGPQDGLFDDAAWSTFLQTQFTIALASDRTGYRLNGAAFVHRGAASLPSEPTCVGAIQIPDGGAPIVIMQDGPTVGGYPKIATIRSESLSRFAQLAPGDAVRFVLDE
ncbi:MAG: biotin-dependent carboxyltransferase family protein [Gemmatimonadaceae bacterium]